MVLVTDIFIDYMDIKLNIRVNLNNIKVIIKLIIMDKFDSKNWNLKEINVIESKLIMD